MSAILNTTRVRSLIAKLPKDSISLNQGSLYIVASKGMSTSEFGSGSGKGGGAGGSVREAGGAMGRKGAAQEEQYFSKQNNELKTKLKSHLEDEIKKHQDAIEANKKLMKDLEK